MHAEVKKMELQGAFTASQQANPIIARDDGLNKTLQRQKPFFENYGGKTTSRQTKRKAAVPGRENEDPAQPFVKPPVKSKARTITQQMGQALSKKR